MGHCVSVPDYGLNAQQQAIMDEKVIEAYCEYIGEKIKWWHFCNGNKMEVDRPALMYFDAELNNAFIVKSNDVKHYRGVPRYKRVNFNHYYEKVFLRFIEAGYKVKTSRSRYGAHYGSTISW